MADPRKPAPFDLTKLERQRRLQCKQCGETKDIKTRTLEYELHRHCNRCGFEWSGGRSRSPHIDPNSIPIMVDGVPAPEDDEEVVKYTGANFRDPNKNYGG